MRKHGERGRRSASFIARVAVLTATLTAFLTAFLGGTSLCAARNLSPPAIETGYPRELINRPVCFAAPMPDEAVRCGAATPQSHGGRAFD